MAMASFSDGFWGQTIFLLAKQVNFPIEPSSLSTPPHFSPVRISKNLQLINMALLAG